MKRLMGDPFNFSFYWLLTCFNDKDNDMTNQKQINENRKIESQHAINDKATGLIN